MSNVVLYQRFCYFFILTCDYLTPRGQLALIMTVGLRLTWRKQEQKHCCFRNEQWSVAYLTIFLYIHRIITYNSFSFKPKENQEIQIPVCFN